MFSCKELLWEKNKLSSKSVCVTDRNVICSPTSQGCATARAITKNLCRLAKSLYRMRHRFPELEDTRTHLRYSKK